MSTYAAILLPVSLVFTSIFFCPESHPGYHITFNCRFFVVTISQTFLVFGDLDNFEESWSGIL